jgi:hypothetical protein
MLIDGKVYQILNFDNLHSLISLSEWAKDNLSLYKKDEKISDSHLILFLEYIKTIVKEQKIIDDDNEKGSPKKKWFDQIDLLLERVKENESKKSK